jgi:hypothetical protein
MAIRRDASLLVRDIGGEIVMLDTRSNQVHQFNRTASVIWRMWEAGGTPETITSLLCREFTVDEQTARIDVVETLSRFQSLGLLGEA